MSEPNGVSPDDMSPSPLSDDELEALLLGSGEGGHPVADFLADARTSFLSVPVGDPSPELIRAMEHGPMSPPLSDGADVIDLVAASEASRRTRMIGTFASFAGTAVGKIAIGSAAAAVSFAAVQATDIQFDDGGDVAVVALSSSTSSSTSTSVVISGVSGSRTIDVAAAGSITVSYDGTSVALTRATPANGWRVDEIEELGGEVEVHFAGPNGELIQVQVEIEDDSLKVRIRDEIAGTESFLFFALDGSSQSSTASTTVPGRSSTDDSLSHSTTSTTIQNGCDDDSSPDDSSPDESSDDCHALGSSDDDDDRDNSGSGSSDDDEPDDDDDRDNSGSGSSDDDEPDDDDDRDNSGSGSSDD